MGNDSDANNTPAPTPGPAESMPGNIGEAETDGQAAAYNGLNRKSALDSVRLSSWTVGGASVVGVGVAAVALGGLVGALSMRNGRSHMPVSSEDSLLAE